MHEGGQDARRMRRHDSARGIGACNGGGVARHATQCELGGRERQEAGEMAQGGERQEWGSQNDKDEWVDGVRVGKTVRLGEIGRMQPSRDTETGKLLPNVRFPIHL